MTALDHTYLRRPGRVKTPKSQRLLAAMIRRVLHDTIVEVEITWPWLTTENAHTMYCDIYVPEHQVIVEYMGYQHYHFPNRWHKTLQSFNGQKRRDRRKKDLVTDQGLAYIAWHYEEPMTETHVVDRLAEVGIDPLVPPTPSTQDQSLKVRRARKRQHRNAIKQRRLHQTRK